jgi:hypothetical protein
MIGAGHPDFKVPQELRNAPPRRSRRRFNAWFHLSLLGVVFLIAWGFLSPIAISLFALFGRPAVHAHVIRTFRGGRGDYRVEYGYDLGDGERIDNDGVPYEMYTSLEYGSPILIHSLQLGSSSYTQVDLPFGTLLSLDGGSLGLGSIFTVFLAGSYWVKIYIPRRLVRNGTAAPGVLVSKGDKISGRRRLIFEYQSANGTTWRRKGTVDESDFKRVENNPYVTILFDVRNPGHSLVYEFCDFIAV